MQTINEVRNKNFIYKSLGQLTRYGGCFFCWYVFAIRYIIRLGYLLPIEDKERICPLIYKLIFHQRATFEFQEKMAVALTSLIVYVTWDALFTPFNVLCG